MHQSVYTHDRRSQSVSGWGNNPRQSQACLCVGMCVCVCYVYVMCMCKGGDWAQSQKAGWVHCVTAHVHLPPSIPASLCMFYFFPAEDMDSGNMPARYILKI